MLCLFNGDDCMKAKENLKYEIKVSIFILAVAALYGIAVIIGIDSSSRFINASGILKPTTFPYSIAVIFILTALYQFFMSVKRYRSFVRETAGSDEPVQEKMDGQRTMLFPVKEFIPILIAFVIYIAMLHLLGFIIDTILLSMSMLFYVNKKNRIRNIVYSVLFPITIFLLFNNVLTIYLPTGTLFGG